MRRNILGLLWCAGLTLPAGCFSPSARDNAPCVEDGACLNGDVCDPILGECVPVEELSAGDDNGSSGGDGDATMSGESGSASMSGGDGDGDGDGDSSETGMETGTGDGDGDVCGDGVVTGTEECDDAGESATCDADCTAATCGDGTTNMTAGETCDDSGESVSCDADCTEVACGDGTTNMAAGETCDDSGESATCDADCSVAACGDGVTNATAGEACDDGGANGDGTSTCSGACQLNVCGDGYVGPGEGCDDSNTDPGDGCSATCVLETCGNGVQDPGEACDDGNADNDDTCTENCTVPVCGDGFVQPSQGETCDDSGESATCDADCTAATCGDGTTNVTAGETCDDSGESATCDADCTAASCGDGTTNMAAGETCDDSGESVSCDADCTEVVCGDGTTNMAAGETCDDSGESATCNADCSVAACGDGVTNPTAGEACDEGNQVTEDCDYGETMCTVCDASCQETMGAVSFCGDGVVAGPEYCDVGPAPESACNVCLMEQTGPLGGDLGAYTYGIWGEVGDLLGYDISQRQGDVDGDGVLDLLLSGDERAYLFLGSTIQGWVPGTDMDVSDADYTFTGENADDSFGASMDFVPDWDGDNRDDIIIGANNGDSSTSVDVGAAYLFLSGTITAQAPGSTISAASADGKVTGTTDADNAGFGSQVVGVDDLNGDGRGEVLVGPSNQPTVWMWKSNINNSFSGNTNFASMNFTVGSSNPDGSLSVSVAGDVDGDGRVDLLFADSDNEEGGGDPGVANDEAGKAYLVSGLEVQLTADLGSLDLELDAAYSFIGDVGDALGSPSFSAVGDIDGDDKSDFVVESVSTGQSCIFLSTTVETLSPGQGAASTFAFSEADLCVSAFDSTTSSTDALALARGDVDGDGLDDWIFGASGMGSGGVTGEVYLVDSATISPATMSPLFVNLGGTSDAIFRGDPGSGSDLGSFTFLGARVASLGDLNNDGKDDFIATGPVKRLRDNSTPETNGKVYIVLSQ